MKRIVMTMWICVVGMVLGIGVTVWGAPLGTAITYQGRLLDGATPADGEYDFEFTLYDEPNEAGIQVGDTISKSNVAVIGGLFTVELDFGSNVFDDEARWLEIGVRPGEQEDPDPYVPLTPRQEVTAAPYALHTRGVQLADKNTFVGYNAGIDNSAGNYNTFVGSYAGRDNYNGGFNTFVGSYAGFNNTTGGLNTFLGNNAGAYNETGGSNIFLGHHAGRRNTSGAYNTFVGTYAGEENLEGDSNTFLGYQSGTENTNGQYNVFIGTNAGQENTSGHYNSFFGFEAGNKNTTANYNTFLGFKSGPENTTGSCNVFLGSFSGGYNTTGSYNACIGHGAGYRNTEGISNCFLGYETGYNNTIGNENLFLGHRSGYSNVTGDQNTFLGTDAGLQNTSGQNNTFLGDAAGYNNTTGSSNTFLGRCTGVNNRTGNGNVFVGYHAGYLETGSNKLYIANGLFDPNLLIYGDFVSGMVGIGTTDPEAELHIDGAIRLGGGERDFEIQEIRTTDPAGWAGYIDYGGIGISSINGTNRQMFMFTDGAGDQNIFTVATSENASASWEADFVIQQNGNVGIGTEDPTEKLQVAGSIYSSLGGFRFPDGSVQTTAFEDLTFPYSQEVTVSGHAFEITNNNLGSGSAAVVGKNNTNIGKLGAPANGVYAETNHTNGIAVNGLAKNTSGYGNVGGFFESKGTDGKGVWAIANSTGGYGVYAEGLAYDFYAAGAGVDWGSSSSIRWKHNIQSIENPLSKLTSLRGVYFDWDVEHGGGHDVGMIAEEVGQVLPEIVCYEENGVDAIGMDYSKLTPLLVEAVKELKREKDSEIAELKAHRSQMEMLRKENVELRKRVAALESIVVKMTMAH